MYDNTERKLMLRNYLCTRNITIKDIIFKLYFTPYNIVDSNFERDILYNKIQQRDG
jgi:hypothetical protein